MGMKLEARRLANAPKVGILRRLDCAVTGPGGAGDWRIVPVRSGDVTYSRDQSARPPEARGATKCEPVTFYSSYTDSQHTRLGTFRFEGQGYEKHQTRVIQWPGKQDVTIGIWIQTYASEVDSVQ